MLGWRRLGGGADADWPGLLFDRASGARARARALADLAGCVTCACVRACVREVVSSI